MQMNAQSGRLLRNSKVISMERAAKRLLGMKKQAAMMSSRVCSSAISERSVNHGREGGRQALHAADQEVIAGAGWSRRGRGRLASASNRGIADGRIG